MISVPGYIIAKLLNEGEHALIYRAYQEDNKKPVLIKLLRSDNPGLEEVVKLYHEFQTLEILQGEGTVKAIKFDKTEDKYFLCLEDFSGGPLKEEIWQKKLPLEEILRFAILTVRALSKIHQRHVIHGNLNPENILWNRKNQQVKIIDFSMSCSLPRMMPDISMKQRYSEAALSFISPEQTGYINQSIDYRIDFYSLGVILYQLVSGSLPFDNSHSINLFYQLLAKQPVPIHEIDPSVPYCISAVIMKLLAKGAEDRYQTGEGLIRDLEICVAKLLQKEEDSSFVPGTEDFSHHFMVIEKMYGRQKELLLLYDLLNRISQGPAELVMLAASNSGVGKNTLVRELYKPLAEKNGYLAFGKFDQFKRNIPYSGLVLAIQDLIQQISLEDEIQIKAWRKRMLQAVGSNGQAIVNIIPALATIIGEQPPLPPVGPEESKNRFNLTFQNFLRVLGSPEHPLVIFLDDFHRADIASLKAMETFLLNRESKHMLIVASYDEQSVDEASLMVSTLQLLKKAGCKHTTIPLKPIKLEHLKQLLVDSSHSNSADIQKLAEICYTKSKGSMLDFKIYLEEFYEAKFLVINTMEKKWYFKEGEYLASRLPDEDNILDVKVRKLSKNVKTLLQIAACIGTHFDLKTLVRITKFAPYQIAKVLSEAQMAEIITTDGQFFSHEVVNYYPDYNFRYHFLHDGYQKAAYHLLSAEERQHTHLKIARLFLKQTTESEFADIDLNIVSHFSYCVDLITLPYEKILIAKLNLAAGKKAKVVAAYKFALDCLNTGISLLPKDSWIGEYNLTLALYTEALEAAYLAAKHKQIEDYSQIIIDKAKNLLDKVKVYEINIRYLTDQNRLFDAISTARTVLNYLGVKLPKHPSNLHILKCLLRTRLQLRNKSIEYLYNMPAVTNEQSLAAMRVLSSLAVTAYIADQKLYQYIVFELIRLSLRDGNSYYSAFAYVNYAVVLCCVLGEIEKSKQFGQLALDILDKFNVVNTKSKICAAIGFIILPHSEHIDKSLPVLVNGIQAGMETGEIEFAGYNAACYAYHILFAGKELNSVIRELDRYANLLLSLNNKITYHYVTICMQAAENLLDTKQDPVQLGTLVGKWANEKTILPQFMAEENKIGILDIYICKLMLFYLFGEYKQAIECGKQAYKVTGKIMGLLFPVVLFYYSLALLSACRIVDIRKKEKLLKIVENNQKKLKEWVKKAPCNYEYKFCLVEAEYAEIKQDRKKASINYDRAIELARTNGFLHEEAIANELAARFYISQGKEKQKVAKIYLNDAYYGYLKWGATAKVKQLEQTYPQIINELKNNANGGFSVNASSLTNRDLAETLDLSAVMKASEAISRETELGSVLKKMMNIAIENAGAQTGVLLLEKGGQWLIEAESTIGNKEVMVLHSLPIQGRLPTSIIQHVTRTKTPLVLEDGAHDDQFSFDPYVQSTQPKSILCLPLMNLNGKVSGILYMENNLTVSAFTKSRIDMLNLLSDQIVIAIDNARLYAHQKELNTAYERFVPYEFLHLLGKNSITQVKVGDQVQKDMTVMFCNLRNFTAISEALSAQECLNFLNDYFQHLEPIIIKNNGFVDKYIGDTIMALFHNADDALHCSIEMQKALEHYNSNILINTNQPIRVGIGLNSGLLTLGTVGDTYRMEGTVVSDVVNTAARIEGLTKTYQVSILITENTYERLEYPATYLLRKLDTVTVRGKSIPITIYEVFDNNSEQQIRLKQETIKDFEEGMRLYQQDKYDEALVVFQRISRVNTRDYAIAFYLDQCQKKI